MIRAIQNALFLALFLIPAPRGQACIWVKGTTLEGALGRASPAGSFESRWMLEHIKPVRDPMGYADALRRLQAMTPAQFAEWLAQPVHSFPEDWPEGLDQAVMPLFQGNPQDAILGLSELNKTHPDNYFIHANLGVALELAGRDKEALEHVEKARGIDPGAHRGTEWMHAAVLRAKIALAADPAWLDTHTISGVPLGAIPPDFELTDGRITLSLDMIHDAIFAHALPRVLFTKPKNAVTAAVLKELARVEARGLLVEGGLAVLSVAEDYGAKDTGGLRKEWSEAVAQGKWKDFLKSLQIMIPLGVGLLALFWAALLWWRKFKSTWRPRI